MSSKTIQNIRLKNEAKAILEILAKLPQKDLENIAALKESLERILEIEDHTNLAKIIKEIDDFMAEAGNQAKDKVLKTLPS